MKIGKRKGAKTLRRKEWKKSFSLISVTQWCKVVIRRPEMERGVARKSDLPHCELMKTSLVGHEISLEDQARLEPALKKLCLDHDLKFAEFSFANAFLYRREHQYMVVDSDPPFIQGRFSEGHYYLIPTVPPESLEVSLPDLSSTHCLFPIPDKWAEYFRKRNYGLSNDRADSDYLITKEKLQTLKGRHLSSRRNLLHQLQNSYVLRSEELNRSNMAMAREVLEAWQKADQLPKEKTDYFPLIDAFENMEKLHLFGRIVYGDDQPLGFTIGELLTPKTAIMHGSKGLRDVKGITPFLYEDFALNVPASVEWINLAQDLGIASLRQAKTAYEPDRILTKWRVC